MPSPVIARHDPAGTGVQSPIGPIGLDRALPALLERLLDVARAFDGAPAPQPPPGFPSVPDGPPSRRERALLVQFAWVAYTVLAGRPPADRPPTDWPYRLPSLVPLSQRRPDVLPALARLVDRVLTAPPLAPLPSPAGFEELLRRASTKVASLGSPAWPASAGARPAPPAPAASAPVVATIDFSPATPEPPSAVIARLQLLAGILATATDHSPHAERRGLFRLGWTGWERLHGEPPYDTDRPYELLLGSDAPRRVPSRSPVASPPDLVPLLTRLTDQRPDATAPSLSDVRRALGRMHLEATCPADVPAPPPMATAIVEATAREAERLLDDLIRQGLVAAGPRAGAARSIEERLAVTSLAWSIYRVVAGSSPIVLEPDGANRYRPLGDVRPETPPELAAAVDATLAPDGPHLVPGAATWLAAAQAAAAALDAASPTRVAGGMPVASRRRRVNVLPEDRLAAAATRPPWGLVAVAGTAIATAWWLSAGP
jgi:hypothetical protein